MSLNTKGDSCVYCHAYLFDDDDIVYCPICGAPHHRKCYNEIGHCALEEFHGTDKQYDLLKKAEEENPKPEENDKNKSEKYDVLGNTICSMCGEKYDNELKSCPKCGAPNLSKMGKGFEGFDFLGGVPSDLDIGDGITANEAKQFVIANTPRYIPKFALLNKQRRASWNWMAFFFPTGWLLSRKMNKTGIIFGILSIVSSLFTFPLNEALYNFNVTKATSYSEMMKAFYERIPEISSAVLIVAILGIIMNLTLRIVSGIFGDYFYKDYTVSSIKKIKSESGDIEQDFRKKGGVNIFMFLIGTFAVQYIPLIILSFF